MLGTVPDLTQVAVGALDQGVPAVTQLSGYCVDGDRGALVKSLESRGAVHMSENFRVDLARVPTRRPGDC